VIPREGVHRIPFTYEIPFNATILADGSRNCGYKSDSSKSKVILITSDSHLFGIGVEDSEGVGYKLQKMFNGFHVINRSIPGSGDGSQLLVLNNSLNNYEPDIIIAMYGWYHHERNILGRSIKKNLVVPDSRLDEFTFPVGKMVNDTLQINLEKYHYTPVPLSDHLAIFEAISRMIEKAEWKWKNADVVTFNIWKKYIARVKQTKARLCVLNFQSNENTREVEALFAAQKIPVIPVQLPSSLTLSDGHANATGHTYMAEVISDSLRHWNWIK
jgi:hypothetical protein